MPTETLGFLLQGVSQQQPKVRSSGQVTEQVNWLSDVNRGLTTRPATERLGALPVITSADSKSATVDINNVLYRVVLADGAVPKVFAYDGTQKTVNNPDTAQAYVSTNAAVYTYDNTVYITNRDKIVGITADTYTSEVTTNWGYVYCLGGVFTRNYTVNLTIGATTVTAHYTTPDGLTAGDADLTTADHIIGELKTNLEAALVTAAITGVTITQHENFLRITNLTHTLTTISCRDGEGGILLKGDVAKARTIAELPKFSAHGDYMYVYGATSIADDFWMRFEIAGSSIGADFGKVGAWKEYFDVDNPVTLDAATMPHILVLETDGTFTFRKNTWEHRRVGNEDSNPTPSFVGFSIRDIREFQGRLTFATSGATVVMSRTDYPKDFFRKTATAGAASDPVDERATMEGTTAFDWLVPFDRDLFVLASNAQYILSGANAITPTNAGIVLATNYNMSSEARPQPTGRTLLFPFKGRAYAGVNEYFTGSNYASTSVDNLTKTASKYIAGEIKEIVSSSNEGIALFLTDNPESQGYIWVYKYLWEFDKKTQSSWSKWRFPGNVRHCYSYRGDLYVWLALTAYDVEVEEVVLRLNLDNQRQGDIGYTCILDDLRTVVFNGSGKQTITTKSVDTIFFVVPTDTSNMPASVIIPNTVSAVGGGDPSLEASYTFDLDERDWLRAGTLYYGIPIKRYLDPSPPIARKFDGSPRSDVQLVIRAYYIDYVDSGKFTASMLSMYRGDADMANTEWFPMDDDPAHPFQENVRTGTLQVPWGEYAALADLRVYSDDIRPTTIQEIRYEPEALKAGG